MRKIELAADFAVVGGGLAGDSVMQGACASRPGRAFVNIIGRHFNLEVVNPGFSGSSRFEPLMAEQRAFMIEAGR